MNVDKIFELKDGLKVQLREYVHLEFTEEDGDVWMVREVNTFMPESETMHTYRFLRINLPKFMFRLYNIGIDI